MVPQLYLFGSGSMLPVLPTILMSVLVLGGGVFTKRTEVLDISGEKCSAKIPKINRNVRGLGSANLQVEGEVYVVGGVHKFRSSRFIEKWNGLTDHEVTAPSTAVFMSGSA